MHLNVIQFYQGRLQKNHTNTSKCCNRDSFEGKNKSHTLNKLKNNAICSCYHTLVHIHQYVHPHTFNIDVTCQYKQKYVFCFDLSIKLQS